MIKVVRIDSIQFHDDWGTQNGPFFSLDIAKKFFVEPMKKLTDYCHAHGILFEQHCCGNAGKLVPAMIEAGVDWWYPQSFINNIDELVDKYKNEFVLAVPSPMLRCGMAESDVKAIAKEFVEKWKDKHVVYSHNSALRNLPDYDRGLYPLFQKYVYEFSRIAYEK